MNAELCESLHALVHPCGVPINLTPDCIPQVSLDKTATIYAQQYIARMQVLVHHILAVHMGNASKQPLKTHNNLLSGEPAGTCQQ